MTLTYQLPAREIEKILRIIRTNVIIHGDNLDQLPPTQDRDDILIYLEDAVNAIDAYAQSMDITIHKSMPT